MSLLMAGGLEPGDLQGLVQPLPLEPDDLQGPFQPLPFHDSMTQLSCFCGLLNFMEDITERLVLQCNGPTAKKIVFWSRDSMMTFLTELLACDPWGGVPWQQGRATVCPLWCRRRVKHSTVCAGPRRGDAARLWCQHGSRSRGGNCVGAGPGTPASRPPALLKAWSNGTFLCIPFPGEKFVYVPVSTSWWSSFFWRKILWVRVCFAPARCFCFVVWKSK